MRFKYVGVCTNEDHRPIQLSDHMNGSIVHAGGECEIRWHVGVTEPACVVAHQEPNEPCSHSMYSHRQAATSWTGEVDQGRNSSELDVRPSIYRLHTIHTLRWKSRPSKKFYGGWAYFLVFSGSDEPGSVSIMHPEVVQSSPWGPCGRMKGFGECRR